MEDTIEICSGCGKMPRAIDHASGSFSCSRCGSRMTTRVHADDYERVAMELDQKFHQLIQKKRVEEAAGSPVEMRPSPKAKAAAKPVRIKPKARAKAPQKAAPAKKSRKK